MLFLHKMLMTNIRDDIAGRFRKQYEYVRISTHVAPAPEHIEAMMDALILEYSSTHNLHFLEKLVISIWSSNIFIRLMMAMVA